MHFAAKDVMGRFNGVFPRSYKDVLSLKGIGDYTAAAIVSIAYGEPYAVVDGNVYRVLSRLFAVDDPIDTGSGKKVFASLAQDILDVENPGTHNQAVMELGALQCVPVNPVCDECPLAGKCLAYASGTVSKYPVKKGKTKVTNRYFNYFDIRVGGGYTYINKRTGNDVWLNLYEFPLIETPEDMPLEELLRYKPFVELFGDKVSIRYVRQIKHVLSHRIIYANFYKIEVSDDILKDKGFLRVSLNEVHDYPVSRLVHRYIEEADL